MIAWMLVVRTARNKGLADAVYQLPLPEPGEAKRAILSSFTKEHSAEYQSQALIDLASRIRDEIDNFEEIQNIIIHISHHSHYVIGIGANDPQKMYPKDSRETLIHSIMYISTMALQDSVWHYFDGYAPCRARRYCAAVAQGGDIRGCGMDAPLPLARSRQTRFRGAR